MIDIPPWSFFEKLFAIIPAIISGVIALIALRWNQKREHHHFRVCCQCLREEIDSHKDWITEHHSAKRSF